jgi:hypothetical protein
MVELQRKYPLADIHNLWEATLPIADDDHIGLWVNSMCELGVLFLMKQKVPCFIVHKFLPGTLEPLSSTLNPLTFYDFVVGTNIVYLVRHNEYQLLAEGLGHLDSMFRGEDGRGGHIPTQPRDKVLSASVYMTLLAPWSPMSASRRLPSRREEEAPTC